MYQQLTTILNKPKKAQLTPQEMGVVIQNLKKKEYFFEMNNQLGTDYLIMLVPLMQTYILRKGFSIIDELNQHVLFQGNMKLEEIKFLGSKQVEEGTLIDLKEANGVVFRAQTDCQMIRIKKNPILSLYEKKIIKFQRQQTRKSNELKKKFQKHDNIQKKKIFQTIEILNTLGDLDLQELIDRSFIKEYHKGAQTHASGDQITHIGYIFSGKIQVVYNKNRENKLARQNLMSTMLSEKEWLCLKQHLWSEPLHSSGTINSIFALIIWIPKQIIQAKFNTRSNYFAIKRLKSILMTKKLIFDRSFATRNNQASQLKQQQESKQISSKLLEKMYFIANTKRTINLHISNKQETPIPQKLMHRVTYKNSEAKSLSKLMNPLCLFPEQYEKGQKFKSQNFQLKRIERILKNIPDQNKDKHMKRQSSTTIQSNPESFYKTMIQRCGIQPHEQQLFPSRKPFQIEKNYYKDSYKGLHHNKSIYNNFRVYSFLNQNQTTVKHSPNKLIHRMTITKYQ